MTGRQAAHYSIIRQRIPERRHFGRKQTRMYQMDKGLLFPELKAEEKVEVEEAYFTGFQCYEEGYEKMNTCLPNGIRGEW